MWNFETLLPMDYLTLVALSVFAICFYRAGRFERSWSLLWAALSIGLGVLTLFVLRWGWTGFFLGQVALFSGITFYRMRQAP